MQKTEKVKFLTKILNQEILENKFIRSSFNFKDNYKLVIKDYCDGVEKYLFYLKKNLKSFLII